MIILFLLLGFIQPSHAIIVDSNWSQKYIDSNTIFYNKSNQEYILTRKLSNGTQSGLIPNHETHLPEVEVFRNIGIVLLSNSNLKIKNTKKIIWSVKNKEYSIAEYAGEYTNNSKKKMRYLEWNAYVGSSLYQFIYLTHLKYPDFSKIRKIFFTHQIPKSARGIASTEAGVCVTCAAPEDQVNGHNLEPLPVQSNKASICNNIDPKKRNKVDASFLNYNENAKTIASQLKNEGIEILACLEGIGDVFVDTFKFFWSGLVEGRWGSSLGGALADYVEKNQGSLNNTSFTSALMMVAKDGIKKSASWASKKWVQRIERNKKRILSGIRNRSGREVSGWNKSITNFLATQAALGMSITNMDYLVDPLSSTKAARDGLQVVWDLAANYISKEKAEFHCLTRIEKHHYICSFLGVLVETVGTWELAIAKLIKAGAKAAPDLAKIADETMGAFRKGENAPDALTSVNRQNATGVKPKSPSTNPSLQAERNSFANTADLLTKSKNLEVRRSTASLLKESTELATRTRGNQIDYGVLNGVLKTKDPKKIQMYANTFSSLNGILKKGEFVTPDGKKIKVQNFDDLLASLRKEGLISQQEARNAVACVTGAVK